jgi:hypothetical protein
MVNVVSKRAENSMSPRTPGIGSCIQLAIVVLLAGAMSSCANRQPTVPAAAAPPTRDVEALIERGCFHCLEQALSRAEERRQTPLAFEAAVLLALRATERGMPSEEWIARARTYADGNPERAEYLEWRWRCRRIHSAGCVMICSSRRNFATGFSSGWRAWPPGEKCRSSSTRTSRSVATRCAIENRRTRMKH